jgi:hypothetical protein
VWEAKLSEEEEEEEGRAEQRRLRGGVGERGEAAQDNKARGRTENERTGKEEAKAKEGAIDRDEEARLISSFSYSCSPPRSLFLYYIASSSPHASSPHRSWF